MRTLVLIDGANLWQTTKLLKWQIDFDRLKAFFPGRSRLLYFTAIPERNTGEDNDTIRLVDYLSYNGYKTVTKLMKSYDNDGEIKRKGNMDMEICIHALRECKNFENVALFSGDGDFRILVEYMQQLGCTVDVYSSQIAQLVSNDMRKQADNFFEINELKDKLAPLVRTKITAPAFGEKFRGRS